MKLSKKIMQISPSATLEVVNKVNKMREAGENVISFGAGEPDFNTPKKIRDAAKDAIDKGFTHYTSVSGISDLKDAIVQKFRIDNNIDYKRENILISNGAKHSLHNAIEAIIDPGDEVIVSSPYWVSYTEMIALAGGKTVFAETSLEDGFTLKADKLAEKISPKTKAIIINSPNNPTGCVLPREELEKIAELALKNNIIIISDEIYEKLIYGQKHFSIASISEEVKNNTITINGVSKTYAMTGWRIGYMAAPAEVIKAASKLQGHTTSNPNSIAQKAAITAVLLKDEELDAMKTEFIKRRDYMYNELSKIEKFIMPPKPEGAFYIYFNISKFGMKSLEFANYALEKAKVALVPGLAFGMDDFVRVAYANSMEEIIEGIKRLKTL